MQQSVLKPPGPKRLQLQCDELKDCAFNFNLRRYSTELLFEPRSQPFRTVAMPSIIELDIGEMLVAFMGGFVEGRGLHSSTFRHKVSMFGGTAWMVSVAKLHTNGSVIS
jgi:hypothetical protein